MIDLLTSTCRMRYFHVYKSRSEYPHSISILPYNKRFHRQSAIAEVRRRYQACKWNGRTCGTSFILYKYRDKDL